METVTYECGKCGLIWLYEDSEDVEVHCKNHPKHDVWLVIS